MRVVEAILSAVFPPSLGRICEFTVPSDPDEVPESGIVAGPMFDVRMTGIEKFEKGLI